MILQNTPGAVKADFPAGILYWNPNPAVEQVDALIKIGNILKQSQSWAWLKEGLQRALPQIEFDSLVQKTYETTMAS